MRKCILFLPASTGATHILRSFLLGSKLQEMGYEVVVGYTQKKKELFKGFFPLVKEVEPLYIETSDIFNYTDTTIESLIEEEIKLIEKYKPLAIVGDFRFTAKISTRIKNVPYISINDIYCVPQLLLPNIKAKLEQYYIDEIFSKGRPFSDFRSSGHLKFLYLKEMYKLQMRPFISFLPDIKIEKLETIFGLLVGELNLINGAKEFITPDGKLPENFHFVGPLINDCFEIENNWFTTLMIEKIDKNRPLIYVNLGGFTTASLQKSIFEAFSNTSYQFIMTDYGVQDEEKSAEIKIPSNFFVKRFIPDISKIFKLCNLVIFHGGIGTIYASIMNEIPVLGIPFTPEQHFLVDRLAELGLGLKWNRSQETDQLREYVDKLLSYNPRSSLRCQLLRKSKKNKIVATPD